MIDLRQYFPSGSNTIVYNRFDGTHHARYTFTRNHPSFIPLYESLLKLPNLEGEICVWQKEHFNNEWTTSTYGILFLGNDLSVTEVGDWLHLGNGNFGAFGYQNANGENCGLKWSPAGGLSEVPQYAEMLTVSQAHPGAAFSTSGASCYAESGLIDVIPSMEVGGRVFNDVVHMVMYHGVNLPGQVPAKADRLPLTAHGVYYRNRSEWNEYAMELWLAPGVGVIKERIPFIENAEWWGLPNFVGDLFGNNWIFEAQP